MKIACHCKQEVSVMPLMLCQVAGFTYLKLLAKNLIVILMTVSNVAAQLGQGNGIRRRNLGVKWSSLPVSVLG